MTQVKLQNLIEQAIMQENSHWFTLAYISPLLKPNAVNNLGHTGEGQQSRNILWSKTNIESSDERHKNLMELFIIPHTMSQIPLFLSRNRMIIGHTVKKKQLHLSQVCIMGTTKCKILAH